MKYEVLSNFGVSGWVRNYFYEEQSFFSNDLKVKSNCFSRIIIGNKDEVRYVYEGDVGFVGCMIILFKFIEFGWNMYNMFFFFFIQCVN